MVKAIARGHGQELCPAEIKRLEKKHSLLLHKQAPVCSPLPGARALLAYLKKAKIAYGSATSGKRSEFKKSLAALSVSSKAVIVDGDMVKQGKPEPDLFLMCQQQLDIDRTQCLLSNAINSLPPAKRLSLQSVLTARECAFLSRIMVHVSPQILTAPLYAVCSGENADSRRSGGTGLGMHIAQ